MAAAAAAAAGRSHAVSEARAARMLAWRVHSYGGLGELRLEEARVPALRAPGDLLVRVSAASLNPLDVAMTRGYGAAALGALRVLGGAAPGEELPLVCGRDLIGEVVRAGPAARFRPGARVWAALPPQAPGTHSQYALIQDTWASVAPVSLEETAAGGAPYAALTAAAAVRAAGLGAAGAGGGARVLVLGLGGVGQAAVQLLAARRHVVTVGCAGELSALALELGAAEALDRHEPEYWARIGRAGPYAAVLDCAGLGGEAPPPLYRSCRIGRYVTLTSPVLRETDAHGVAAGAAAAALRLAGQNARAPRGTSVRWAFFAASGAELDEVRVLADRGRFRVCVERVFPWWEAPAAYERAGSGAARGKLVLDFTRPRDAHAAATPQASDSHYHQHSV